MTRITQPLRDEHRGLFRSVESLCQAAEAAGGAPLPELNRRTGDALDFLVHHLIPHAEAEERALYPAVGRAMGPPRRPPP